MLYVPDLDVGRERTTGEAAAGTGLGPGHKLARERAQAPPGRGEPAGGRRGRGRRGRRARAGAALFGCFWLLTQSGLLTKMLKQANWKGRFNEPGNHDPTPG